MPTFIIAMLTFSTVVGAGFLLMQPALTQYVDVYAVRVRPRKEQIDPASQPKDSMVLLMLKALGVLVLRVLPGLADRRTIALLMEANYRTQAHLAIYIGIKTTVAVSGLMVGLGGVSENPGLILLTPFIGVLGWLLPNFFLAARVKQRQQQILRELPTIIDLLVVCAQAGLGLMMAVDKVSREVEESCPVLCGEMQQLIQDVKIFAKSVPMAMREMGERCGVDELINMASALIAAEQKGADISYPLRQQGTAIRERLKRKKEEEAAKVPVKMVPVIMIFIMPLILAPMLGPAIVVIVESLKPIIGSR
jgi:tight adherence protein C